MHVLTNTPFALHETDKNHDAGDFEGITLQRLGRYLRNLRESRRATQASLSTKTGAIAGRKISRSRISEIENAKRDPVSERELRVYMVSLKCTPRHIDGLVRALRQCTTSYLRETPADPVPGSPEIPNPDPAELSSAEDNLTLHKEQTKDNLTTAGHEEEGRGPQEDRHIHLVDASQSQSSRRRWQRRLIKLADAVALVVVAFVGLNAELFLPRESTDPPTSLGSPPVLPVPRNSPLLPEGIPDVIKNTASPDPALVRVNKRPSQTSKNQGPPAPVDTVNRDTTEHIIGHCCVHNTPDQIVGDVVFPMFNLVRSLRERSWAWVAARPRW